MDVKLLRKDGNEYAIQSVTQAYSEKENPVATNRNQTYDLPTASSDALDLPLRKRRLVIAKWM